MEKLPELKIALTLIVIGIPGWYVGSLLEKTGSGPVTTYMGIISIVLGIAILGWVAYKNISRPGHPEQIPPETVQEDGVSGSRLSPREMNSFKAGVLGAVISAGSLKLFNMMPGGTGQAWLSIGYYCGVMIAGFIVFYTAAYQYQSREVEN